MRFILFWGASKSSIWNFISFSIDCHPIKRRIKPQSAVAMELGQRCNEKTFRENSENENNNKARTQQWKCCECIGRFFLQSITPEIPEFSPPSPLARSSCATHFLCSENFFFVEVHHEIINILSLTLTKCFNFRIMKLCVFSPIWTIVWLKPVNSTLNCVEFFLQHKLTHRRGAFLKAFAEN